MCELVISTAIKNGDYKYNYIVWVGGCDDHYKHFGCYPLEFEFKDKIYQFNEFKNYIKN